MDDEQLRLHWALVAYGLEKFGPSQERRLERIARDAASGTPAGPLVGDEARAFVRGQISALTDEAIRLARLHGRRTWLQVLRLSYPASLMDDPYTAYRIRSRAEAVTGRFGQDDDPMLPDHTTFDAKIGILVARLLTTCRLILQLQNTVQTLAFERDPTLLRHSATEHEVVLQEVTRQGVELFDARVAASENQGLVEMSGTQLAVEGVSADSLTLLGTIWTIEDQLGWDDILAGQAGAGTVAWIAQYAPMVFDFEVAVDLVARARQSLMGDHLLKLSAVLLVLRSFSIRLGQAWGNANDRTWLARSLGGSRCVRCRHAGRHRRVHRSRCRLRAPRRGCRLRVRLRADRVGPAHGRCRGRRRHTPRRRPDRRGRCRLRGRRRRRRRGRAT